jgi:uncharacterized protein YktB (UPF0637 family)
MSKKPIKEVLELYIKKEVSTMKIENLQQMSKDLAPEDLKILKDCQKVEKYKNMSWNVVDLKKAYEKLTKNKKKEATDSSESLSEEEKQIDELKEFVKGKKAAEMIQLIKEANLEQVRYYKDVATRKTVIEAIQEREKELLELDKEK